MEPETRAAPPTADVPPEESYPFWNYSDLALFFGFAIPCLLIGSLAVRAAVWLFGLHPHSKALELLPAQFLGYALLFCALYLLLRLHYGRPFWQSLRWTRARVSVPRAILLGFLVAISVAVFGALIETPDVASSMKELMTDRTSVLLLALFAVTLGPLCEELAFRGFLQPLLVRSLGPARGIILAAAPFGLLHLAQYAWSWRHALLISLAGVAFGWMRQISGSTRTAAIMHAAYNLLFFAGFLLQGKKIPTTW